jgi:para-nitrobenzyl esterase
MSPVGQVIVETPFGNVRGSISEGVSAFHRIPYAAPPIGDRRFLMAGPAPHWPGIRDTTAPGPIPPQLPSRLDRVMGAYPATQDEDCLHLDVWTSHARGDQAPVLVFIHGGAFMTGGGSLPCYDGHVLARDHGLVVVTVTYRLGLLGFPPLPELGGLNLGIHDQIAALRWIKQAVGAFGGDPDRITVAGQSAGAFSIATMLGSESCKGLFARAILMSAPLGLSLKKPEDARAPVAALLDVLGLASDQTEALRSLPVERLLSALEIVAKRPPAVLGDVTPPFMPVLDGSLIPRDPLTSILNGSASWCDTIVGVTREEFAAFLSGNPDIESLTDEQLLGLIARDVGEAASAALERAKAKRVPSSPAKILGDWNSDQVFIKPGLEVAKAQVSHGRAGYSYRLDWQSPKAGLDACHCLDLPFLFGNSDVWRHAPMIEGADLREVDDLSRLFRGAVAAFAATGNPNGPALPEWPGFGDGGAILHVDRQIAAFRHIA